MYLLIGCSLRGFLVFFDLAQLITLVWLSIKTRYIHSWGQVFAILLIKMCFSLFGRTPRDIREWTQPQSFEYSVY
jgi:calcium permeable stress-gated cation channel